MSTPKQPCLKPQDVVVTLKITLAAGPELTYAQLAASLRLSASEVHAAVRRSLAARLLRRDAQGLHGQTEALLNFMLHGVPHAFPWTEGPIARGMPTGVSAPALQAQFEHAQHLPWVWPDPEGEARGPSVLPLYPTVPAACRADSLLYAVLASLDAWRGGAAREREAAEQVLRQHLQQPGGMTP